MKTNTEKKPLQFKRRRSIDELRAELEDTDLELDVEAYGEGSDFVVLQGIWHGKWLDVAYSTFNGKFYGAWIGADCVPTRFSSDDDLDDEPWFKELLNIFYA